MSLLGMNTTYLIFQCLIPLFFFAAWVLFAYAALRELRASELTDVALAFWAALIVVVPFLGAMAFYVVRPGLAETNSDMETLIQSMVEGGEANEQ